MWKYPKLLIEGTRMTHKTELAYLLNGHSRLTGNRLKYEYRFPFFSGEWGGWEGCSMDLGLHNCPPDKLDQAHRTLRAYIALMREMPHYLWIVDRLHITLWTNFVVHHGLEVDVDWVDKELDALGFHLIVCCRAPDSFAQAIAQRRKVSVRPEAYGSPEIFVREQDAMLAKANESRLPTLVLDTTAGDIAQLGFAIAEWLERTGAMAFD